MSGFQEEITNVLEDLSKKIAKDKHLNEKDAQLLLLVSLIEEAGQ